MIEYDTRNWARNLFLLKGTVAPRIASRVLLFTCWSALVVAFNQLVRPVAVSSTVHTLVGVALGLLLVFRTNASYERFWEGRKLWAGIVSASRNLGRMTVAYLRTEPGLVEAIILWGIAFSHATMNSLRGERRLGPSAARLPQDNVAKVLAAPHVPTAVALRISDELAGAWKSGCTSDRIATSIESNVQFLVDCLGGCERIQNTPLPFAYVAHLRLALFLYCATLPFALVEIFGWTTVLDTLLIVYILFGIEEIGVEVENPFGHDYNDLPLDELCGTIERELLALIQDRCRAELQ